MCQMIDSEVKLEAILADAGGGKHYTRIAPESYLATSISYEEAPYYELTSGYRVFHAQTLYKLP